MNDLTTKPVNVALIGCGRISSNHIEAILFHSTSCSLTAVCDPKQENIDKLLAAYKSDQCSSQITPKAYLDYEELLDAYQCGELNLDLIVLCTPSGLHARQAIQAANVGLNVCTEKPMATRYEDGLEMVAEFDKAKKNLFVVKQNRFNDTLQLLKKQIDKGRFGRIYMVALNVFWQRPQSYYDLAPWRGTWEFDGGALMNQASHYVDLLDWLIGPVESVTAAAVTLERNIEVEDTAALLVQWRSGAIGTMAVTMLTFPQNLEGSITILGEKGSVKVGGTAVNEIQTWKFLDQSPDDEKTSSCSYHPKNVYGNGHIRYYQDMLSALTTGSTPICDGRQGLRSLELLIAAYKSSNLGVNIRLPLST